MNPEPDTEKMGGLPHELLARVENEPLGPAFRNIPDVSGSLTVGTIGQAGWHVRDLLLPTLTLRLSALQHNIELYSRWCKENGVDLVPHGKTTMAPHLFDMQMVAGAWGITAATVAQARLMREFGVRRIVLANEVVDPAALRWIAQQLTVDPGFDLYVLVDSVAGVERMDAILGTAEASRPLSVLLELGVPGGRAGTRTPEQALAVATRVRQTDNLVLAGVECFEGVYPQDRSERSVSQVDGFVAALSDLLVRLDAAGLFGRDEVLISAGGSAYPDRVVAGWGKLPTLSRSVRRLVRSGGYLTHDHGTLERVSPLSGSAQHPLGALMPALQLWAYVLSTPEPGLAICGFGKRDAPFDAGLPTPVARLSREGGKTVSADASVDRLNDQHAFLRHTTELAVGDIVVFGLSHPCTAFDKWSLIPVLDDENRVVSAVRTYF